MLPPLPGADDFRSGGTKKEVADAPFLPALRTKKPRCGEKEKAPTRSPERKGVVAVDKRQMAVDRLSIRIEI